MKNKIIDLFCGCGGLSLGFEMAGFEVSYAIDMWEQAVNTYNYNHKNKVANCVDIHSLSDDQIISLNKNNDIVGIIGGPPCQGFSKVGTRDNNDPRNHLYLEYYRVVKLVKPEFFVIENVSGLLTLSKGMFRDDIIKRFGNLGYNISFKEVLASDYGVPQNRRRVFFVGMKNSNFVFPEKIKKIVTSKDAISDLLPLNVENGLDKEHDYATEPQNEYQRLMRGNQKKVKNHQITIHTQQTIDIISMVPDGGTIYDLPDEYWNIRKYRKGFERMPSFKPCHTVDTGHRNYFHYSENRIPTARENARLQSFPDWYEFLGTKTDQYKEIGNAVPPLLASHIAKAIMKQIQKKK
ncbi:DNA (cytosine-5)-methyltransferase 1 [Succinivibrio dextrinosolvens]|uniref:DNA cytosine methyltransferase n=1 Tax=Succinivibrio dextrinosolvens TaxID=83771 RepID=UPI0008F0D2FC|nr:DNA cytosine methyltransferase [Succinivibrio dextrinosolvens]SFS33000.1 DNA (cytosine-5)-methyltransferase 1 [Succinivibrio dextrinosolvens]